MKKIEIVSANFSDIKKPNIEISKFQDGEDYLKVVDDRDINKGDEVYFYHRLYPNQDESLIQALFVIRWLKEIGANINLVSPYLPYSRQDKIWKNGEFLNAKYLCEILSVSGVKKLITFDCHFLKKKGEFEYGSLKIENHSLNNLLISHGKELFNNEKFEIISPDVGSNYMVGKNGNSMKKIRGEYTSDGGKYRKISKMEMNFEVDGKNFLLIDDMIAGGGTMLKAIDNLKKNGAKKIICCASHGFFLNNSLDKIVKNSDYIFVSNSIPSPVSEINFMDELK